MTSKENQLLADIGGLNAVIGAAAFDVNRWSDVAQSIQGLVPESKVLFQVTEKSNKIPHQVIYSGISDHTMEAYREHYWRINPWTEGMNNMPMSSFMTSSELYADRLLRKTEFFADLVTPERGCDAATALKFAAHIDRYAFLSVHYDFRHLEQAHCRVQSLLRSLVPRLRTALEVNRVTNPTSGLFGGRALIDQLLDIAMVVDNDCRLLACNAKASDFLERSDIFLIKARDIVGIANTEANTAFARLVRDSCSGVQDRARLDDLAISSRSESFSVTCLPVAVDQTTARPIGLLSLFAPKTVAMVIVRPMANEDPSVLKDGLRRRFRLTGAEVNLILEFERGGTLSEIAERVGVSRSTIQSHLKSIFAKTGTTKQRDVVTLVTAYRRSATVFSVAASGVV